jgi:hypothetical protein
MAMNTLIRFRLGTAVTSAIVGLLGMAAPTTAAAAAPPAGGPAATDVTINVACVADEWRGRLLFISPILIFEWLGYKRTLVSAAPTFLVADARSVQNDLDTPVSVTFTSQQSLTTSVTTNVGTSASLFDFLTVNVSTSIVQSRTTSIGVSTTATVAPHTRLLGQYGVEAFNVVYDVQTLRLITPAATAPPSTNTGCQDRGTQRLATTAPTVVEGWRLSAA